MGRLLGAGESETATAVALEWKNLFRLSLK